MEDYKMTHLDEFAIDEPVEQPSDTSPPDVSEKPIRPSQSLNFGTHISIFAEDYAVQMAAVSHFGHFRRILEIDKQELPAEQTGSKERLNLLTKLITDFVNRHRGPFSIVSLAIAGRETALRNFLMPVLRKNYLATAVEIEAKKQLPFPVEDCTYDFRPISLVKSSDRELYNISLLAATRRLIKEKLEPFGDLKQTVEHIYHAPDIVGRLLPYIAGFDDFTGYTTLNIGQDNSEVAFYRGSALEFYTVVSVGMSILGDSPGPSGYAFLAESLVTEIQTAIDFYTGRFSRTVSNRILVYGDLASNNEVIANFRTSGGYTFERFPIDKLKFLSSGNLKKFESAIPVCLPAFAAASCPAGMADVLPKEFKTVHRAHRISNYAKAALATLTLSLIAVWGLFNQAVAIKQQELTTLNTQVNDFVNSEAYRTYNILKRQIAIDKTYLASAIETPTFLSLNLKELTNLTPKEIKLMHLIFRPDDPGPNFVLEGNVYSDKIPPEIILAEFIENLSSSPFYSQVEVNRHVKRKARQGFEIDFSVRCRGII